MWENLPQGSFASGDWATFVVTSLGPAVWGVTGLGAITLATLLAPGDAKYYATKAT
jgi:hypothetical protein